MEEKKEIKGTALNDKFQEFIKMKDKSYQFSKKEIEKGKLMAVLSYILPPLPYLVEKENRFVRFHAVQGMNLMIVYIIYYFLSILLTNLIKVPKALCCSSLTYRITPWWVSWPLGLIKLFFMVIVIIAIISACAGKAVELPVIRKMKILKK